MWLPSYPNAHGGTERLTISYGKTGRIAMAVIRFRAEVWKTPVRFRAGPLLLTKDNIMSYTSVTVTPTLGGIVPTLTFDVCDDCGALVAGTSAHDEFHTRVQNSFAVGYNALQRSYDYEPPGRYHG